MPSWLVHLWALGLAVSGAVGLLAVLAFHQWREAALWSELGSMLLGSGALALVTGAIVSYAGGKGLLGIGLCVAWAAANLGRGWQIWRELRGPAE